MWKETIRCPCMGLLGRWVKGHAMQGAGERGADNTLSPYTICGLISPDWWRILLSFRDLLRLLNGVVCNKGFRDASQQEREVYEDPDWARRMAELWSKLSPLYQQLHTYVRRRLYEYYGPRRIRLDGPLPAHILGTYTVQLNISISIQIKGSVQLFCFLETNLKGQIQQNIFWKTQ